jgi:lysophospholipase L1-like esterase
MGPADKPLRRDQGWVHRQRTTLIAEVQRRLALHHGCAYFDTVAFMGGKLSMLRWIAAEPPLARDDYVHLTPKGYKRLGEVLLKNLMQDFAL